MVSIYHNIVWTTQAYTGKPIEIRAAKEKNGSLRYIMLFSQSQYTKETFTEYYSRKPTKYKRYLCKM